MRIQLFLEVVCFFMWIGSAIIFLTAAYLLKLKPTTKELSNLEQDDNPWNDKFSDDFMRYVKREMYSFSYAISKILMDVATGFSNIYGIALIGARDFYPTLLCYCIYLVVRTYLIGAFFYTTKKGLLSSTAGF